MAYCLISCWKKSSNNSENILNFPNSPGKNTRVGFHALLQEIFPPRDGTHILCLLLWRVGSSLPVPPGKPTTYYTLDQIFQWAQMHFIINNIVAQNTLINCCVIFQSLTCAQLYATPLIVTCQALLSTTVFQSLLKSMSTESVMLSNIGTGRNTPA